MKIRIYNIVIIAKYDNICYHKHIIKGNQGDIMAKYRHTNNSTGNNKLKIVIIILLSIIVLLAIAFGVYYFFFGPGKPVEKIPETTVEPTTIATTEAQTIAPTENENLNNAKKYLETMSKDEKICQLFICTPEALTDYEYGTCTAAGEATEKALKKYPVGGLVYYKDNIESSEQIKEMIENTQSLSKTPLFVSVDEEGGENSTCNNILQLNSIKDMSAYQNEGSDTALSNAKTIGDSIKKLGFNLDFAPVTDVNSSNNFMSKRAYSNDYSKAAGFVKSAIEGFHQSNILCTSKHFPGLGNATGNPDEELVTIDRTKEQLTKEELIPFKSAIDSGVDMIMISHGIYKSLDDTNPATLSERIVPELLRKELEYKGLTVTESLSLKTITDNYSVEDIVDNALIKADIDILLNPSDLSEYIEAIKNSSLMTDEILDAKVLKILELKFKYGILSTDNINKVSKPAETTETTDNDNDENSDDDEIEETIPFHNEGGGGGENPEE